MKGALLHALGSLWADALVLVGLACTRLAVGVARSWRRLVTVEGHQAAVITHMVPSGMRCCWVQGVWWPLYVLCGVAWFAGCCANPLSCGCIQMLSLGCSALSSAHRASGTLSGQSNWKKVPDLRVQDLLRQSLAHACVLWLPLWFQLFALVDQTKGLAVVQAARQAARPRKTL